MSRYSIGIRPECEVEVLERSNDLDNAWVVLCTYPDVDGARQFIRELECLEVMQRARWLTQKGADHANVDGSLKGRPVARVRDTRG